MGSPTPYRSIAAVAESPLHCFSCPPLKRRRWRRPSAADASGAVRLAPPPPLPGALASRVKQPSHPSRPLRHPPYSPWVLERLVHEKSGPIPTMQAQRGAKEPPLPIPESWESVLTRSWEKLSGLGSSGSQAASPDVPESCDPPSGGRDSPSLGAPARRPLRSPDDHHGRAAGALGAPGWV